MCCMGRMREYYFFMKDDGRGRHILCVCSGAKGGRGDSLERVV